jgi:hypothetical protein
VLCLPIADYLLGSEREGHLLFVVCSFQEAVSVSSCKLPHKTCNATLQHCDYRGACGIFVQFCELDLRFAEILEFGSRRFGSVCVRARF